MKVQSRNAAVEVGFRTDHGVRPPAPGGRSVPVPDWHRNEIEERLAHRHYRVGRGRTSGRSSSPGTGSTSSIELRMEVEAELDRAVVWHAERGEHFARQVLVEPEPAYA